MESKPKLSKSQKDKIRRDNLKEQDPEEYRRRQDLKNENARRRYCELKSENPDEYREKLDERNERRATWVFENPEEHQEYLLLEREKYLDNKIEVWNNLFDTYFAKNNVEMSQKKWESLKQSEIKFYKEMFDFDVSIKFLYEIRQENLEFLRKNLDVCCAGSLIFFIKTFVHNEYDQRNLTEEEREWVRTLELDKYSPDCEKIKASTYRKEYYKNNRECEIEKQKSRNDEKSSIRKNVNLNLHFIAADPNKVLSVSDICFNPTMTNYSAREEFKVNLWKNLTEDEKPEFLEKWKLQRQNYEKEVEELSIEFKEDFLKRMGDKDYTAERKARHEKYLDHFRFVE